MRKSQVEDGVAIALILGLCALFYSPVLFQGLAQVHAESANHGVPLFHVLSDALAGKNSALWTDKIYGGFPIFAEGQGAYAHPVTLLCAYLFDPVTAFNVFQIICIALSGIGAYLLCRSYGCSPWPSLFGTLAVVFSTLWIGGRSNLSVGAAISCVPWVFLAMNCWLRRPGISAAIFLGTTMSLMILSGYPHIVHGTVIYMVCYLLVLLVLQAGRLHKDHALLCHIKYGVAAVIICCGLAAVQLIPLLELVEQSHRREGAELIDIGLVLPELYFRGFLFTFAEHYTHVDPEYAVAAHFPVIGSMLVCAVASCVLLFVNKPNLVGHLLASVLLTLFGFSAHSEVFNFFYDNKLIPGMHNFRAMYLYLFVAIAGFATISAIVLEHLSRVGMSDAKFRWRLKSLSHNKMLALAMLAIGLIWLAIIIHWQTGLSPVIQYYFLAAWFLISIVLLAIERGRWIGLIAAGLLVAEVFMLRTDVWHFGEKTLFREPDKHVQLVEQENLADFKFYNMTVYAFFHTSRDPRHPELSQSFRSLLSHYSADSNVFWNASSMGGSHALPTLRHKMSVAQIKSEIRSETSLPPGIRLMDYLSLRFIVGGAQSSLTDLKPRLDLADSLYVNEAARPKFQLFREAKYTSGPEETLSELNTSSEITLFVETAIPPETDDLASAIQEDIETQVKVLTRRSTEYSLQTNLNSEHWLFIADSAYPGWKASIDGQPTPVYPAQVLGKALLVPAGTHTVTVFYEPLSFRVGLLISVLTVLIITFLAVFRSRSENTPGSAIEPGYN